MTADMILTMLMLINCNKTKQMIPVKAKPENIPYLGTEANRMLSKLYFLKLLKRSSLSIDFHYFYITVIRPISEYRCTVWNRNLTSTLSDKLESCQKEHYKLFMVTKLKECPIKIHFSWLICNAEILSKLCNPLQYPVTYSRTKRYHTPSTTPWATSKIVYDQHV